MEVRTGAEFSFEILTKNTAGNHSEKSRKKSTIYSGARGFSLLNNSDGGALQKNK